MYYLAPWVLAGALFAWAEAFAGVTWTFANSQILSLITSGEGAGVYRGPNATERLVVGPLRESTFDRTNLRFATTRGFIATTDAGIFVIAQSGRVTKVPLLHQAQRNSIGELAWRKLAGLHFNDVGYLVLHVKWRDPVAIAGAVFDGEIVAIRDDGAHVRFAVTLQGESPALNHVKFDDAMLKVDGYPRALDFDRFDLETTVQTEIARRASDGQSSFVSGWDRAVEVFKKFEPRREAVFVSSGVQSAVNAALDVLKRDHGSVILRGPAGVGKEFAAREIVRALPRGWTVFEVTPDGISSTAGVAGNFEARLLVMKAAAETRPVVWLLRNVAAFRGTGTHSKKDTDFFDGVLPELQDGTLRMIGLADDAQYAALVRGRDDVRETFDVVPIGGVDDAAIREVVVRRLERDHLEIGKDAFKKLRGWAARFGARASEPGRTTGLVTVAARLTRARNATLIDANDVREAVRLRFNVPPELIDHDLALARLDTVSANLTSQLPGNDDARAAMVAAARRTLFNLSESNRPRATGLFLGPKGAGKTVLVEAYAREMGLPFLALAMGEYPMSWHLDKFIRAFGEFLDANPFGIVFLDELDKAAPEVQNALLKALESNAFVYSGEKGLTRVPMVNTQVFGASNAGEEMIRTAAAQGRKVEESALRGSLAGRVSEYLADRMDFVTAVYPAEDRAYRAILRGATLRALGHFGIAPAQVTNFGEMIDAFVAERPPLASTREAERSVARGVRDPIGAMLSNRRARPETLPELRFRFVGALDLECEDALRVEPADDRRVIRADFGRR